MGVIDQTTHTLSCTNCKVTESVKILQYGSSYGGSWQDGKPMDSFDVTWTNDRYGEPRISVAQCKKCGAEPTIEIS